MKIISKVLSLFLLLSLIAPNYQFKAEEKLEISNIDTNSSESLAFIVMVDGKAKIDGGNNNLSELVKTKVLALDSRIKLRKSFAYLINGFSIDAPSNLVPQIMKIDGVADVRVVNTYKPMLVNATEMTNAVKVWSETNYKGEGMVVSIIDTGIDINHKDMRLSDVSQAKIKDIADGFNAKVPFGYNYADDNAIVKDKDTKSMHGMHVAGIVAANATNEDFQNRNGVRGVAPEAQLLAMKVFSNNDGNNATSDAIVRAIEDSILHGADIINMSLGLANGFANPDDPEIIAVDKARQQGLMVVIAAGNEQMATSDNPFSRVPKNATNLKDNAVIATPGTASSALTVASVNNNRASGYLAKYFLAGVANSFEFFNEHKEELWNKNLQYPLVDMNNGTAANYVGDKEDLTGKIALIQRGSDTFKNLLLEAKKHHAVGAIIYNNVDGNFGMLGVDEVELPAILVTNETGRMLIDRMTSGEVMIQVSFDANFVGANEVSSFTSYGPTPELEFKPEVSAPGGNIMSTFNNNTYGLNSGTSMATPHVSGALALIVGKLKTESLNYPHDLFDFAKKSLINTAKPLLDVAANTQNYVSPRRQGAGLIDIKNALNNRVIITDENDKAVKSLKEIDGTTSFTLSLHNYGNSEVVYNVNPGVVLREETDSNHLVKDLVADGASLTANKTLVTLAPGASESIEFTLNIAQNVVVDQFLEGFIRFIPQSGTDIELGYPYISFYGDWSKEAIFDKPIYDNNSIFKTLGITGISSGEGYLGSTFNRYTFASEVNPDLVAISPNDDGSYDALNVNLGLLRNLKDLELDVVRSESADAKSIIKLAKNSYIIRSLYENSKRTIPYFVDGLFDGKIFNQDSGKYQIIDDGVYFVRLKGTVHSKHDNPQYTYLKFRVDTTKPNIELISKGFEEDNYVIKFRASDDGIGLDSVYYYMDNGEKQELTEVDGVYTIDIDRSMIEDGLSHTITYGAVDKVNNFAYNVVLPSDNSLQFFNVASIIGKNNKYLDLENMTYHLVGYVGSGISDLRINNVEAIIDREDNTFALDLPVVEGRNNLDMNYLIGDQPVNENHINFIVDTTPPVINITSPNSEPVHLDENHLEVIGTVSDNVSSNKNIRVNVGNSVFVNVGNDGSFTGETNIDYTRDVVVRARDEAGNEATKVIKTIYQFNNINFTVYLTNGITENLETNNPNAPFIHDNNIVFKGIVSKPVDRLTIDGQDVIIGDDLRFEIELPITAVVNKYPIVAYNQDGVVIYQNSYTLFYDTQLPSLSIKSEIEDDGENSDGLIYTKDNPYNLEGSISDNGLGYKLYINGNIISRITRNIAANPLEVDNTNVSGVTTRYDNETEFNYPITINNNNAYALVEVSDNFNNSLNKRFRILLDQVEPEITINGISADDLVNLGESVTYDASDDHLTVVSATLNDQAYESGTAITSPGSYTLSVTAKDKAGNVSTSTRSFNIKEVYTIKSKETNIETVDGEYPNLNNYASFVNSSGEAAQAISAKLDKSYHPGDQGDFEASYEFENGQIIKITFHITNRVTKADTSELEVLIKELEAINPDAYTGDSYQALVTKIAAAKNLVNQESLSEDEVTQMIANLNQARSNLINRIDNSSLASMVTELEKVLASDYTEDSYQKLATALVQARQLLENTNATEVEIEAMKTHLTNAHTNLQVKPANKTELQALVNNAKDLDLKYFNSASLTEFKDKLAMAESVLSNKNSSQSMVNKVLAELEAAIQALELKDLVEIKSMANQLVDAKLSEDYSEASLNNYNNKLETLKLLLAKEDVRKEELIDAINQVNKAKNQLTKKVVIENPRYSGRVEYPFISLNTTTTETNTVNKTTVVTFASPKDITHVTAVYSSDEVVIKDNTSNDNPISFSVLAKEKAAKQNLATASFSFNYLYLLVLAVIATIISLILIRKK